MSKDMMLEYSKYTLFASLALIVLALVCYVLVMVLGSSRQQVPVAAKAVRHAGGSRTATDLLEPAVAATSLPPWRSTAPTSPGSPWRSSPHV